MHVYTVVFKIIAVFKRRVKLKILKFYFNTHKCIGNIAHSILNQNMKKISKCVITLQKVGKKGILGCYSSVCIFLYKVKHLLYKLKNA